MTRWWAAPSAHWRRRYRYGGLSPVDLRWVRIGNNNKSYENFWYDDVSVISLNGDYSDDSGHVDAADYVVWRNSMGGQAAYHIWRQHYGSAVGNGVSFGTSSAVPEPNRWQLCHKSAFLVLLSLRIGIRS